MLKICFIGAGSSFGSRLSLDILCSPVLRECTLGLCDIHEGRLMEVVNFVQATIDRHHLPTKLIYSTNRREILKDANFVITAIAAGCGSYFGRPFEDELSIPLEYGVDQSVADSYSVGATFRLLRTAPSQLAFCKDMEELCPDALVLNHTNPMMGLTMIHSLGSSIKNVGICHGVHVSAGELNDFMGLKREEVAYRCVGINHLAWFLDYKRVDTGESLYPLLDKSLQRTDEEAMKFKDRERVRLEIYKRFGIFPTESSHHDSEYMPYFRRTPELMEQYNLRPRGMRFPRPADMASFRPWMKPEGGDLVSSREYTIYIIEAIMTDVPYRFNANIMNNGLISNLPQKLCVEVPAIADRHGVHGTAQGNLPTQLAGIDLPLATCVQLAVEALLERDKEKAFYAVALDPNVAAVVPLPKIREMFERLWEAEGDCLSWMKDGVVIEKCAP
jgi:alpha-galactosidase